MWRKEGRAMRHLKLIAMCVAAWGALGILVWLLTWSPDARETLRERCLAFHLGQGLPLQLALSHCAEEDLP
jgi:hypothetical protein